MAQTVRTNLILANLKVNRLKQKLLSLQQASSILINKLQKNNAELQDQCEVLMNEINILTENKIELNTINVKMHEKNNKLFHKNNKLRYKYLKKKTAMKRLKKHHKRFVRMHDELHPDTVIDSPNSTRSINLVNISLTEDEINIGLNEIFSQE